MSRLRAATCGCRCSHFRILVLAESIITRCSFFFFFNDTATTEIYTLSLHDALPICLIAGIGRPRPLPGERPGNNLRRSEEHTSELQSPCNLVCRLLLEKKKHTNQSS